MCIILLNFFYRFGRYYVFCIEKKIDGFREVKLVVCGRISDFIFLMFIGRIIEGW